jgi:hypothetical protein
MAIWVQNYEKRQKFPKKCSFFYFDGLSVFFRRPCFFTLKALPAETGARDKREKTWEKKGKSTE